MSGVQYIAPIRLPRPTRLSLRPDAAVSLGVAPWARHGAGGNAPGAPHVL